MFLQMAGSFGVWFHENQTFSGPNVSLLEQLVKKLKQEEKFSGQLEIKRVLKSRQDPLLLNPVNNLKLKKILW